MMSSLVVKAPSSGQVFPGLCEGKWIDDQERLFYSSDVVDTVTCTATGTIPDGNTDICIVHHDLIPNLHLPCRIGALAADFHSLALREQSNVMSLAGFGPVRFLAWERNVGGYIEAEFLGSLTPPLVYSEGHPTNDLDILLAILLDGTSKDLVKLSLDCYLGRTGTKAS